MMVRAGVHHDEEQEVGEGVEDGVDLGVDLDGVSDDNGSGSGSDTDGEIEMDMVELPTDDNRQGLGGQEQGQEQGYEGWQGGEAEEAGWQPAPESLEVARTGDSLPLNQTVRSVRDMVRRQERAKNGSMSSFGVATSSSSASNPEVRFVAGVRVYSTK